MKGSKIRLRKLKLRLRDYALLSTRPPTAIWQQPLQSVLAPRSCSATDSILTSRKENILYCKIYSVSSYKTARETVSDDVSISKGFLIQELKVLGKHIRLMTKGRIFMTCHIFCYGIFFQFSD